MDIAVVGAGWAGCAAAVTLARLGHCVTVFEQGAIPGGRARRVPRAGLPLDNGQHLFLGAYVQTRNVLAAVNGGDGERGLVRAPLSIASLEGCRPRVALHARRLPAPLGLLGGLLTASGLTLAERFGVIAWFARLKRSGFRCAEGATAADLIGSGPPAAAERLWSPLCLAALNTPASRACGQVFANVLEAAFAGAGGDSDFLFASTDLSALFPEPALAYVAASGGRCLLRTRAQIVGVDTEGVSIDHGPRSRFDAAILAVGPHQVDATLPRAEPFMEAHAVADGLAYEPITTVWLGYRSPTPLDNRMARLDDAPGQWVVDRPDVLARCQADATRPSLARLVAVVISAGGEHETLTPQALAIACDTQLRRLSPGWPPLAWAQVIAERRATYACTPDRPIVANPQPHPRVALAGDWIDTELPATIEAAVRTGVHAAIELDSGLAKAAGGGFADPLVRVESAR